MLRSILRPWCLYTLCKSGVRHCFFLGWKPSPCRVSLNGQLLRVSIYRIWGDFPVGLLRNVWLVSLDQGYPHFYRCPDCQYRCCLWTLLDLLAACCNTGRLTPCQPKSVSEPGFIRVVPLLQLRCKENCRLQALCRLRLSLLAFRLQAVVQSTVLSDVPYHLHRFLLGPWRW